MCLRRIHNRPFFEVTRRPAEREALRRLREFRAELAEAKRIRPVQASMLRTLQPRRCACAVPVSECTYPDCEPYIGEPLWRSLPAWARRCLLVIAALVVLSVISLRW